MKQLQKKIEKAQPKLQQFAAFLLEWQKKVNLISPNTISEIETRHVLDSAQLFFYLKPTDKILFDMGSGAGFPGLILAILNHELNGPLTEIVLVESDTKKSVFLREAVRVLGVPVTVKNCRLENVTGAADVVTARALAQVEQLLNWGRGFIHPQTTCLFLKGKNVQAELANVTYSLQSVLIPSVTATDGVILKLTEVQYG